MLTAINVPDISLADDAFTRLQTRHPLNWVRLSGLPSNPLERLVRGVRISRYRAALQTARAASAGSFVISHMPLMTAAVASALKLSRRGVPHLGFAFNFTDLPVGWRRVSVWLESVESVTFDSRRIIRMGGYIASECEADTCHPLRLSTVTSAVSHES